ncbi:cell wall-binding repeat-containing protein [Haloimpatiens sp. FM7315]|uniref:cell wall-binding repeat-containing protein n=1 Tax=Haloimpatiens sp. FM7315 TaxID=3298609 RepID=UPI00370CB8EB
MIKKNKVFMLFLLTLSISLIGNKSALAKNNMNLKRLEGLNRYETCSKVASDGWSKSDYAVICNGQEFPDALSSAPLAKKYNAPILLTESGKLTDSTKVQLQKLKVKKVFIVGGEGAVSLKTENTLKTMKINIERICGKDRFETSTNVAKKVNGKGIFVVSGQYYEDALSVSPIASKLGYSIVLVGKTSIPDVVKSYIKSKNCEINVVGGSDVINADVVRDLRANKVYNGATKCDRNVAIINDYKDKLDLSKLYIASDKGFADALSGSALAGLNNNPIILVGNNNKDIVNSFIKNNDNIKNINILGGEGAVSEDIVNSIVNTEDTSDKTDKKEETISIKQTVKVPDTLFGNYEIRINSIESTNERNEFSYSNPYEVYKINYTYKLLSKGEDSMGVFLFQPFDAIDSKGEVGYSYPNSGLAPEELKITGSKCSAEAFIGVNNETNYLTLTLDYMHNGEIFHVTFKVPTK